MNNESRTLKIYYSVTKDEESEFDEKTFNASISKSIYAPETVTDVHRDDWAAAINSHELANLAILLLRVDGWGTKSLFNTYHRKFAIAWDFTVGVDYQSTNALPALVTNFGEHKILKIHLDIDTDSMWRHSTPYIKITFETLCNLGREKGPVYRSRIFQLAKRYEPEEMHRYLTLIYPEITVMKKHWFRRDEEEKIVLEHPSSYELIKREE